MADTLNALLKEKATADPIRVVLIDKHLSAMGYIGNPGASPVAETAVADLSAVESKVVKVKKPARG